MAGYTYLDAQPIDDGAPYVIGWDETDFGSASLRQAVIQSTAAGSFVSYPLTTAYSTRNGKLAIYGSALDILDKRRLESDIKALLSGNRQLHMGGRWLNVILADAREVSNDSRKTATMVGVEAVFMAPDPLWSLAQPLKGIDGPAVNVGPQWDLFDDNAIPALIPDYIFTANTFTLDNWGNAFTWAAGTITDGPVSTTVYLKGPGATRVPVVLDGSGDGTFAATESLYLAPGNNTLRVENLAGALVTVGGSFAISFGDTYMRFH